MTDLKFLVFSDFHDNYKIGLGKRHTTLIGIIKNSAEVDFIVNLGDNTSPEISKSIKIIATKFSPYISTLGNHDLYLLKEKIGGEIKDFSFDDARDFYFHKFSIETKEKLRKFGYGVFGAKEIKGTLIEKSYFREYLHIVNDICLNYRHHPITSYFDFNSVRTTIEKSEINKIFIISGHTHDDSLHVYGFEFGAFTEEGVIRAPLYNIVIPPFYLTNAAFEISLQDSDITIEEVFYKDNEINKKPIALNFKSNECIDIEKGEQIKDIQLIFS